ncbi:MAG: hypothetical protein EA001_00285 [Oscillatoriales cyanobacterium]|nr:MAG: hypothetical protein EA001_00285 [Oscillatoriales cyanobacterium]
MVAAVWNEQWIWVATGASDRNSDNSGDAQANFGQDPGQTPGGQQAVGDGLHFRAILRLGRAIVGNPAANLGEPSG